MWQATVAALMIGMLAGGSSYYMNTKRASLQHNLSGKVLALLKASTLTAGFIVILFIGLRIYQVGFLLGLVGVAQMFAGSFLTGFLLSKPKLFARLGPVLTLISGPVCLLLLSYVFWLYY